MAVWTLARKDLRLLARDPRSLVVLLLMPLVFITIMGLTLGEGFGQKASERLRVSVVVLDRGLPDGEVVPVPRPRDLLDKPAAAWHTWADVVLHDLTATGGVRVERLDGVAAAEELVRAGRRPAVLVLGDDFSERVQRCSFLGRSGDNPDPLNPFFRDGVNIEELHARLVHDPAPNVADAIIEQVAQVTLLRVVMPWMIGRAFDKISDVEFIDKLAPKIEVPQKVLGQEFRVKLSDVLTSARQKRAVGQGVSDALSELFAKYDLRAKDWARLTRDESEKVGGAGVTDFRDEAGTGLFRRGAKLYQVVVPSNLVMFSFFLLLTAGWLFVAERRQGTLVRLRAAPVGEAAVVLGKLLPLLVLSVAQGLCLLGAGWAVFGIRLGEHPVELLALLVCTSLAATGLATLVGVLARTEGQVAVYGVLLAVVLAGVGGCLYPRATMPETMQTVSLLTPHAWALDAYNQLLFVEGPPDGRIVATSCVVLSGFALGFFGLAWLAFYRTR